MTSIEAGRNSSRRREWGLATKTILGFWALHLAHRAAIALIGGDLREVSDPALAVALTFGFLISFALCALLIAASRRGLAFGLGSAVLLSLPFSLVYASTELALFYHLSPELNGAGSVRTLPDGTTVTVSSSGEISYRRRGEARATTVKLSPLKQRVRAQAPRTITANATGWYFFYFGLGSFFVGMSSAARLRRAERRAAEYQRLAQQSQLRALRYQINPHFLFNTLNSLSALILARRPEQAETMILNLSEFFRSTLTIDPTDDITIREEIALQRLYLDIESARFPNRLAVDVSVPEDLAAARVPALLLQPLVENAIKHGVALSREKVTVRIEAAQPRKETLRLVVENERRGAGRQGSRPPGAGVGLRNVAERLSARFGDAAACVAEPVDAGRYRVTITLPLVLA